MRLQAEVTLVGHGHHLVAEAEREQRFVGARQKRHDPHRPRKLQPGSRKR